MGFGWRRRSKASTPHGGPEEGQGQPRKAAGAELELVIPNHFLCPVSLELMRDPVTLSSGITYDRQSIEKWLKGGNLTCPVTNQTLKSSDQIPNHALRRMIQDWSVENRRFGIERVPTPRVPVTSLEISRILSGLEDSIRSLDIYRCLQSVQKINKYGRESEKNKSCIVTNGASKVLSAAFYAFQHESFQRELSVTELLEETLSTLSWMLPLDNEACVSMGQPASLSCLVGFSKTGDLSTRGAAVSILKQLSHDPKLVLLLGEVDCASESLLKLIVERPVYPAITKASLSIIHNLIFSSHSMKLVFLEMGLMEAILEVLVDYSGGICERALWVMDELCGSEEGRDKAYCNSLTVALLVKKIMRGSALANVYSVSTLWRLVKHERWDEQGKTMVEALQVGAFQKILLMLQCGCDDETKEKATELLKLMNPYKRGLECIESADFKDIKRSF
ncbi:hypothetical protein SAY87_004317 [Trapa incisa]|uniref:U-box domain-containing protein n=1 Tax=Trapa incisa TaxID=236973 RepID=A0AAN7JP93_9MYRT|nr:hypothetical protein SAY87_004317 [Trapa incisa]